MSTKNDRIAQLKAQGMPTGMIASLVGCTSSYVSQLSATEEFMEEVARLQLEAGQEEAEENKHEARELGNYKDKLAGAEHRVLDNLLGRLDEMDDRTALSMLTVIGQRRDAIYKAQQENRRPTSLATQVLGVHGLPAGSTLRMVELSMPAVSVPELTFGPNSEVTAIGSRSVTPMPAATLLKILEGESTPALELPSTGEASYG